MLLSISFMGYAQDSTKHVNPHSTSDFRSDSDFKSDSTLYYLKRCEEIATQTAIDNEALELENKDLRKGFIVSIIVAFTILVVHVFTNIK